MKNERIFTYQILDAEDFHDGTRYTYFRWVPTREVLNDRAGGEGITSKNPLVFQGSWYVDGVRTPQKNVDCGVRQYIGERIAALAAVPPRAPRLFCYRLPAYHHFLRVIGAQSFKDIADQFVADSYEGTVNEVEQAGLLAEQFCDLHALLSEAMKAFAYLGWCESNQLLGVRLERHFFALPGVERGMSLGFLLEGDDATFYVASSYALPHLEAVASRWVRWAPKIGAEKEWTNEGFENKPCGSKASGT